MKEKLSGCLETLAEQSMEAVGKVYQMKNFTTSFHKNIKIWADCKWFGWAGDTFRISCCCIGKVVLILPVTDFWKSIGYSFIQISSGFFIAVLAGIVDFTR